MGTGLIIIAMGAVPQGGSEDFEAIHGRFLKRSQKMLEIFNSRIFVADLTVMDLFWLLVLFPLG